MKKKIGTRRWIVGGSNVGSSKWAVGNSHKLQATSYKLIALFLVMLTMSFPFSSALFDWSEERREEETGESILVNVKGYEPEILPSSLIEDGDVPVYVYLTGLTPGKILGTDANAEPIYGNVKIKHMFTRPLDQETLDYVRGSPKYIEPRQYSLDNLGYLVVTLKQIDREADVPEEIDLNMKAEITFENADRLYSMIEQDLVIPESPDEAAWRQSPNFNEYRFFGGRGAIRASSIDERSAELTVYGGQDLQWPFTGSPRPLKDISLDKGETSDAIRMRGESELMTNAFRVKLTDITDPSQKRAKIRVNINGEEREYVVTEGSRLYPGSSLIVQEINVINRGPDGKLVTYEIVVKGPRDRSTASKSFVARAGEAIAGLAGYVSESAAEAITEATRDEYQAGVSTATQTLPGAGEAGTAGGAAGTGAASSAAGAKTSFIVMSDMHTHSGGGRPIRVAAVEAVKNLNPEFVLITGDMVNGEQGTTSAEAKAMWDLFESETRGPLSDAGITVIPVAGNHDMVNSRLREQYKAYWNNHKPAGISINPNGNYPYYYSFDRGANHFVVLESWFALMNEEQLSWLGSDLSQANAAGKSSIVFSHLPLTKIKKYRGAAAERLGEYSEQLLPNSRIKSILKANNIAAFIHGDTHIFYEGVTDGIRVVAAGPVGGGNRWLPMRSGEDVRTGYMIVPVEVDGRNIVSYGLSYPGFTAKFDESIFRRADMSGYSFWNQGEGWAEATAVAEIAGIPAGTQPETAFTCTAAGGVCKSSCGTGQELLFDIMWKGCGMGKVCCGPSVSDRWCTSAGGKCGDSSQFKCLSEDGTRYIPWEGGNKCNSQPDADFKCCPTGNIDVDLYPCGDGGHCKTGCDRVAEERVSAGDIRCDSIRPGTICCKGIDEICTDQPPAGLGGICADSRELKCINKEGTAEVDWVSQLCLSNPASWYKCCPTGEVGMLMEELAIPSNTDLACTSAGGVCADKREFNCYKDNTKMQRKLFDTGKCMSKPDDLNYVCCASGVTGPKAEATAAGEGVCAGKVILLRETDTAEQWNETISKSTQDQVYCTAAEEFKRIAELYPGLKDNEGALYEDKAYYRLGEIYYWLGDSETALKYYKLAVRNNIGSFIPLAQARVDELEEEARLHTTYSMSEFEENGMSIKVKLLDVLWQDEADRPRATIEVENEGTKKLEPGKDVFGSDLIHIGADRISRKYNWRIAQINSESVVIEKHFRENAPPDYRAERRYLPIRQSVRVDDKSLRLKSVDLKKFAIVTIIPGTGAPLRSETNFTVHIPIEKRLISLTPDEISSQINSTQAIIDDLNEVIDTLNEVVVVWKKVCLGTFLFLTLKNSFFTGMARTQARRMAMHGPDGRSGWDQYCRANSGDGRLYDDYEECIIENSDNIEGTIDAAQDAVERVNDEMENYREQEWYRELASDYPEIRKYGKYAGDELFDPQQLRDYRYWQLMKESSAYSQLSGERQGAGYEYNLRREVDESLGSFNLGNEEKEKAYGDAVGDINEHYPDFDSLSEQDRAILFNDLYGAHLAAPDTRSNDFPYVESLGVTPLATIRRENRELYSNTPNGKVKLREANIQDYQRRLNADVGNFAEGSEEREIIQDEMVRVEAMTEGNAFMPLRTNQGQVYADENDNFYVAMTAAYATGRTRNDYDPAASAEFYPDGKPYCIPTGQGNFVKVLDFYRDGSPAIVQEWNVGEDGFLCTDDDVMVRHQSMLERPEQESSHRSLVETATRVGSRKEGQVISAAGRQFTVSTSRSSADNARSQPNCYDTMDPDDCRLLFGVCDPVMCPPSRFNLGGTWQVNDVVQTGMIGSVVLGLPNFDIPYEPVPICLTGVLAGLQNIKSVLRGYVECLKTAEINGQSVGICDKIRSVFICELLWKEAIAILNIKGGLFKWVSQTFFGQEQGGGEYLTFESSLQNVEDSFSFFTTQYATTAFASYQARSMEEIGTTICKQAIFGKLPALGEFFDQLAQPESPPQYTALVTEFEYSETFQQSRYETFYHIYAGEDNDATYSVFLKNSITGDTFYTTERCYGRQGSIAKGGIASFNVDCPETKGYDQVCITLNGNTECGFGKVSTSFALNYLTDMIVADEAMRQIDSEEECYPSSPVTSPSLGSLPLPGKVEILSSGIQRVCSLQNPGAGTNPLDWKEVGTCGKDSTGRLLGSCWLDMRTVSIHDTERMAEVTSALEEAGLRELKQELGITDLLEEEDSLKTLRIIEGMPAGVCEGNVEMAAGCSEITNAMSAYRELETRTIVPQVSAVAGYRYSCLVEKAAQKCARYDLKREVEKLAARFEYDIAGIHAEYSMRMQDEVIARFRGEALAREKARLTDEFKAKVQEAYMKAQEKLMGLAGMDAESNIEKYGKALDAVYYMYYNLQVPFIVEEEREEAPSESRGAELECRKCYEGWVDGFTNRCSREECYALAGGKCYFKEGVGITIWDEGSITNECHACGMVTDCSAFNADMSKCGQEQCMAAAGLSCEEKYGRCAAVEAGEGESTITSTALATTTTGSKGCRPTPPDFFKKPQKELTLNLDKIGKKCDHPVMRGSSMKTEFPQEMIDAAIKAQRETGIPAGYLLAQARHETGPVFNRANGDIGAWKMSPWGGKCRDARPRITDYWVYTGTVGSGQSLTDCTKEPKCIPNAETPALESVDEAEIKQRCEDEGCVWTKTREWCKTLPGEPYKCAMACFNGAHPIDEKTLNQAVFYRDTMSKRYCTSCGAPEDYMGSVTGFAARMGCVLPGGVHDVTWDNCLYKIIWENCLEDESNTDMVEFLEQVDKFCGDGVASWEYSGTDMYAEGYSGSGASTQTTAAGPSQTEDPDADHQYCQEQCGAGLRNLCDAAECHGAGPCYFKEGSVDLPVVGGVRNPFTDNCYGCAKAASCADFNSDEAMCKVAECPARAGLSCEWKNGACRNKEEAAAGKKVAVLGDSITVGLPRGKYVDYLNEKCRSAGIEFENFGKIGATTADMKQSFDNNIKGKGYDELIVMGGINNICGSNPSVWRDLTYIYNEAKRAEMRVTAVTITPWKGAADWTEQCQANQAVVNSDILTTARVDARADAYTALVDTANPGQMKGEYSSPDKKHPNVAGQREIGKTIYEAAYQHVC